MLRPYSWFFLHKPNLFFKQTIILGLNNKPKKINGKMICFMNDSACLAPQLEMGGWSRDRTHPANVLVPNWVLGKPAAFDLSVTLTLNAQIFQEACVTAGSAALAAQIRKH